MIKDIYEFLLCGPYIRILAHVVGIIHPRNLMDRSCNLLNPSKVNDKCVLEGKFQKIYLIYKVKLILCGAIYKGKTQETFNKILDGYFYNVQHIL